MFEHFLCIFEVLVVKNENKEIEGIVTLGNCHRKDSHFQPDNLFSKYNSININQKMSQ